MSIFVCNDRRKKLKTLINSDWAAKLAESDEGSYFDQEQWLKELNKQPSAECDLSVSTSTSMLRWFPRVFTNTLPIERELIEKET